MLQKKAKPFKNRYLVITGNEFLSRRKQNENSGPYFPEFLSRYLVHAPVGRVHIRNNPILCLIYYYVMVQALIDHYMGNGRKRNGEKAFGMALYPFCGKSQPGCSLDQAQDAGSLFVCGCILPDTGHRHV